MTSKGTAACAGDLPAVDHLTSGAVRLCRDLQPHVLESRSIGNFEPELHDCGILATVMVPRSLIIQVTLYGKLEHCLIVDSSECRTDVLWLYFRPQSSLWNIRPLSVGGTETEKFGRASRLCPPDSASRIRRYLTISRCDMVDCDLPYLHAR